VVRFAAMLPRYLFWAILFWTFAYALWRGRADERIAASVCLAASVATRFAISPLSERYTGLEVGLLLIDGAVLAAFVAIALRSKRFWPLWIAGLQLTASMSHLMKVVEFDLLPRAYAAAAVFWSYPILLIIIVGTWRTHRRSMREPSAATA
jgi:hypothetical protein